MGLCLVISKQEGLQKAEPVKGELLLKMRQFPLIYPVYLCLTEKNMTRRAIAAGTVISV